MTKLYVNLFFPDSELLTGINSLIENHMFLKRARQQSKFNELHQIFKMIDFLIISFFFGLRH